MDRREFLTGSAAAVAGMASGDGPAAAVAGMASGDGPAAGTRGNRPNVLMILVDQWRLPRWTPLLKTPAVDRLAARGVSFSEHFVSASPCSPSRACLLTGTYTTQNGMYSNCDFVEGDLQPSLDPGIRTIGHVFRDNGYATPYRGKWHLTRWRDRSPVDPLIDYGFEGWAPPDAPFGGPPYWGKLFDPLYTNQSLAWLADPENHLKPWLLVSSLVDPHDVCGWPRFYPQWLDEEIRTAAPPDNWKDALDTKPGSQHEFLVKYRGIGGAMDENDPDAWRRYLDYYVHCTESADAQIGRILDALEASGQADNTIVVFTSDHGEMGGSHRLRTKGNFAYEEVMNVPLIVSWPGVLPEGVATAAMASNVDVVPTLCSLAGMRTSHYMPGMDLAPVLRNPESAGPREDVLYHVDWESVFGVGKKAGQVSIYDNPAHVRTMRDRKWKYSHYFAPGTDAEDFELYNLAEDPREMSNLAADAGYRTRVRELHERMLEQERQLVRDFEG